MNAAKNNMRGLTVFISDIRNAQSKEGEEKRVTKEMAHIRKEFREAKNVDGYQRRKYVCKLLYIYILGYDIDFGHMEAVTLLSSIKFQEKAIGYLALGVLLHESHELIPLIINSLQEDLQSRLDYFQCLALGAIANIGGKEMAESLAPLVQKLLVANTSPPHIKKRAAQALLRLYRKYPGILSADTWADKVLAILDDTDVGVLTSVCSLLLGVVQEEPAAWAAVVPRVVNTLARVVIGREYAKDYVYYSIPAPWLQVALLKILRNYPPPESSAVSTRLAEVLMVVFNSAESAKAGSVNHKNALNAILFEAIHLVIHYEGSSGPYQGMLKQAAALLGRFISAKETNIRYLGLDSMRHLASLSSETASMVKKYQDTVVISLRDADISIRRRALDLLYSMCDHSSSKTIVGELLTYLVTADYQIREELVLKIAALAEKFASNYAWYVDVILQLISTAGDHVSDQIWHRVIKIVTNHEDIQEYAARTVFAALGSSSCHEATVKVGGYILGEFGHLIAEQPGSGPMDQFRVLHAKFPTVGLTTRAMLLTTYAKIVNLYPELTAPVQDVFRQHQSFIDAEIQQRACEYYHLSSGNETLMQAVLDVIPAWNEKQESGPGAGAGVGVGVGIGGDTPDMKSKGTRGIRSPSLTSASEDLLGLNMGSALNASPNGVSAGYGAGPAYGAGAGGYNGAPAHPPSDGSDPFGLAVNTLTAPLALPAGTSSLGAPGVPSASNPFGLQGAGVNVGTGSIGGGAQPNNAGLLDMLGGGAPQGTSSGSFAGTELALAGGAGGVGAGAGALTDDQKSLAMYRRMCLATEGVLYEDGQLQIGMKSEYQRDQGRIMLFFGNSSMTPLTNFRTGVAGIPQVQVQLQPITNTIAPKSQVQQLMTFKCVAEFMDPPTLQVSFMTTVKPVNLTIRLPIVATKFTEQLRITGPDFFNQWKQYTGKPYETQEVIKSPRPIDLTWITKVLQDGMHLAVLKGVDPSINNLVAAGTFHAANGLDATCLVRMETNPQANMVRLTIRASSGHIANALQALISQQLSN
eukprot:TRINITY_DN1375_c0_g1_i2.p1 TRINITY_DN1375_c0_g1~~TRINITY_DN1375_c0_g1_i2.p1  ORF type:complete len:1036 (+),score=302.77 TRINITY_DN1375_c0_g1_i2:111-3218(+)